MYEMIFLAFSAAMAFMSGYFFGSANVFKSRIQSVEADAKAVRAKTYEEFIRIHTELLAEVHEAQAQIKKLLELPAAAVEEVKKAL